uniref:Uncharacterized protein n=1 Tax=Sphaeramia orbicularis TaxID=375764 RepID=A0A673AVA9_9TELE
MSLKGEIKAYGAITYDSTANKLRSDQMKAYRQTIHSCVKKSLQSTAHPLDIPDDAKYYGTVTAGSRTIEGEGIKIKYGWEQFHYSMSVTMGCLPMTTFYFTEPTSFLFSLVEVEHEIKDPDLLVVPSFCENQPLEETPEGTVNSFLNEFV